MSSIATLCAYLGKDVYGYDRVRSKECIKLEQIAHIRYYSTPDNVSGMDMVIYTNAMSEDCFEYKRARECGIPLLSRANFLGYILSLYKNRIGVSGIHGKSTTTAMLGHIFEYACKNPTVFCGATMKEYQSSGKIGGREWTIFEACEYENSFLQLHPTEAVVLNIELDHPDFFKTENDVLLSFKEYIKGAGRVYINGDCPLCAQLQHPNLITVGFSKNCRYRAEIIYTESSIRERKTQGSEFLIYKDNRLLSKCSLSLFGRHFVFDALCAISVACECGIDIEAAAEALSCFNGIERRMELIKITDTGRHIFEDYAHHPTEIKASLASLKERGFKEILCVFQAHTYSRTYRLYSEFSCAFSQADELILAPIFPARETDDFSINQERLASDWGGMLIRDSCAIVDYIKKSRADCVVLMGAGDIAKIKCYL